MVKILTKARTLIIAFIAMIVLTVSRVFVLLHGIDYSTGLFSPEGDIYNIIFYLLLTASGAFIIFFSSIDNRDPGRRCRSEIRDGKLTVIGATMIVVGAVESLSVMNEFTKGLSIFSVFVILGCIGYVVGGVMIASSKEIKSVHSVPVILIITSYIAQGISFFLQNSLISKTPQKLMMMAFLTSVAYFWLFFGRMLSSDKRKSTKFLAVATGYFAFACSVSYIASTFILLGIDSEKWMRLTCTPGIILAPAALAPAVIATVILFSNQKLLHLLRPIPAEEEEKAAEPEEQNNSEEMPFV